MKTALDLKHPVEEKRAWWARGERVRYRRSGERPRGDAIGAVSLTCSATGSWNEAVEGGRSTALRRERKDLPPSKDQYRESFGLPPFGQSWILGGKSARCCVVK